MDAQIVKNAQAYVKKPLDSVEVWTGTGPEVAGSPKPSALRLLDKDRVTSATLGGLIDAEALRSVLGVALTERTPPKDPRYTKNAQIVTLSRTYLMKALELSKGCEDVQIVVEVNRPVRLSARAQREELYVISYVAPKIATDKDGEVVILDGANIYE